MAPLSTARAVGTWSRNDRRGSFGASEASADSELSLRLAWARQRRRWRGIRIGQVGSRFGYVGALAPNCSPLALAT